MARRERSRCPHDHHEHEGDDGDADLIVTLGPSLGDDLGVGRVGFLDLALEVPGAFFGFWRKCMIDRGDAKRSCLARDRNARRSPDAEVDEIRQPDDIDDR